MSKEFRDWLERVEMLTGERNDLTGNGMRMAYANAIQKYDELFEKVIIPQFVADWIEDPERNLAYLYVHEKPEKVYEWVFGEYDRLIKGNRFETLLEAISNGYEVEKETKYVVKVPHTASNYYTKSSRHSIEIATKLTAIDIAKVDDLFHFTEKEIAERLPDIPKKYWGEIK